MDWELKLMQILACFEDCEGTWYELEWESYGVMPEEKAAIQKRFAEREREIRSKNFTTQP